MKPASSYSRGYLIALVATVLWSTTGPFISYLSKTYALPSLVLAFWRDLFVSFGMLVGLLVFSRSRFHLDRSQWKFMVFYGLTLAVFNSMWTFSVQFNGAAVATVLDQEITQLLAALECPPARAAVTAERSFLSGLGGGCAVPVAAYAQVNDLDGRSVVSLKGLVASTNGQRAIRVRGTGEDAARLGIALAQTALSEGASKILAQEA